MYVPGFTVVYFVISLYDTSLNNFVPLGRVTSTGVVQELALSSGLAFSGASITATGSGFSFLKGRYDSGVVTTTSSFTVTIGQTMANTNYTLIFSDAGTTYNGAIVLELSAKTTTTFTISVKGGTSTTRCQIEWLLAY